LEASFAMITHTHTQLLSPLPLSFHFSPSLEHNLGHTPAEARPYTLTLGRANSVAMVLVCVCVCV